MNDMWVTFNIKEDLLPKVKIGSELNAYVPGLAQTIRLKVNYMAPQAGMPHGLQPKLVVISTSALLKSKPNQSTLSKDYAQE